MRHNPIWIFLSLLPSLVLSSVMGEDSMPRSFAFSRPFVGKDLPRSTPRVPRRMTLSKETEEKVRETLESGLANIGVQESAYIANASQKARALCVSLYDPAKTVTDPEEIPLQMVFSSKSMTKALVTLATMEKESIALTEELLLLTAQLASLAQELAPIEKNLGVLSRAIQEEKTKEKDPKRPANFSTAKALETKMEELKKQKAQLEAKRQLLERRRVPLEEQKERKEQEIFVHKELIELREKRDILSQVIQEEENNPPGNPDKLTTLKEKRDALDQGGWETILSQATLKMLKEEHTRLGKSISQESEKASSDAAIVEQLQQKRTALEKAMGKFSEVKEKKRRIKRVLALIKEKLTPTEINDFILGDRAVVTGKSFFTDRIIVLERLAALSPKIRQKLMQQAQRLIGSKMSADERISIAKAFVAFERAEDGEEFATDLSLHKVGPITPKFIKNAARAWRDGRKKFQESLRRIRSFQPSTEFVNSFLELPEDAREKFLSLFSKSPSPEEIDVLYLLTEIDRRNASDYDLFNDPIEEMAKFKKFYPKKYEDELKRILILYRKDPDSYLSRALEEKKKTEKEALRKIIMEKLTAETLRRVLKEGVGKELDVENMRKERLRKMAELKTPDTPELKAAFERQLAQQIERLTNERFTKESLALTAKKKQEVGALLAEEIEERLAEELEGLQLLQIHPFLMPFEPEILEDDVFTEKGREFETKKQSAPPPSPQSPQPGTESGYDTSDHDSSEPEM